MSGDQGVSATVLFQADVANVSTLRMTNATLAHEIHGTFSASRDVCLPSCNALTFVVQNANVWARRGTPATRSVDIWILSATQTLIGNVHEEMRSYKLYEVLPHVLPFLELLTNWYVLMNRGRLKGYEGDAEQRASLNTLLSVQLSARLVLAPVTPFLAELIYQRVRPAACVPTIPSTTGCCRTPTRRCATRQSSAECVAWSPSSR